MYYLLALAIILMDRFSKMYIYHTMLPGESIPVIDGIFNITYIRNTGAAFSILEGKQMILILFPLILMIMMALYMKFKGQNEHWTLKVAIALIISGGVGNLIDRVAFGYVVDFFNFIVWPVFNIADISICIGCALIIIYIIWFEKLEEGNNK